MYRKKLGLWVAGVALALQCTGIAQAQAPGSVAAEAPAANVAATPAPSGPALVVYYLEFPTASVARGTTLLRHYGELERQARRAHPDNQLEFAALQEIGRPERWIVIEAAASSAALQAARQSGTDSWQQIEQLLISPPDERPNHALPGTEIPAPLQLLERAPSPGSHLLYEVAHVDFAPNSLKDTVPALQRWIDAARAARGNTVSELWQQDGHPNHFAVLLVWQSRADRNAFADGTATRTFRHDAPPASPLDMQLFERRY